MTKLRGCRALLVEDEMLVAMAIEDALIDSGCEVVGPIARVDTALDVIRREPLNFALLDINLGGVMSYPIADELIARGVPFSFVTGYGKIDPAYADFPCLNKPFLPYELEQHIFRIWAAAGGR